MTDHADVATVALKTRTRRLAVPAVFAVGALVVLIGLGNWQMKRLTEKDALIARVAARSTGASIDLSRALSIWRETPDEAEFARVAVPGRFDNAREFHVIGSASEGAKWQVVTPFLPERPQVGAASILVIRGFVPDPLKQVATRSLGQIEGAVTVEGRIRRGELGNAFTPDPDVAKNVWYRRDLPGMLHAAGALAPDPAPFYIELSSPSAPGGWPRPDPASINVKNDHLGYALTWYGLALTLVGVFGAFALREWRREA